MPRTALAVAEEYQTPQVATSLDSTGDSKQLIAVLEDQRARFYRFQAETQELTEIQFDPKIDLSDRVLDAVVPISVDALRGRTRDAVRMVLLINSSEMADNIVQVVLDCIRGVKESSGRVVAYGGGRIRMSANEAWLKADEKYSVTGTRTVYSDELRATQIFDDLDSMRDHFGETTGYTTADGQHGPIEDFWKGVSQTLEEEQRRETWNQVMRYFHSWMEHSNLELLHQLTDWERGTRQNPHAEELFYERVKAVQDLVGLHILVSMREVDRDFYDESMGLGRQGKPKEAIQRLMEKTLEILSSGGESVIFNEELIDRLRELLRGEELPTATPSSVTDSGSHGEKSGTLRVDTRASRAQSRTRQIARWAIAAAFLAAPVATFHKFFGLNKEGFREFTTAIVDNVGYEPSNPFPFLESHPASVRETLPAVKERTIPCSIGDGLHITDTSPTPVYIFDIDGKLENYPPCEGGV